jgi:hypothetical protein
MGVLEQVRTGLMDQPIRVLWLGVLAHLTVPSILQHDFLAPDLDSTLSPRNRLDLSKKSV